MLVARATAAIGNRAHWFDAGATETRPLRGSTGEHLLVRHGDAAVRLDVIAGTIANGPVTLRFDIAADDRLPAQIATLRLFGSRPARGRRHVQLAQRALAFYALDARGTGASLRETADLMLGLGAWPGDGEHRKSLVRRLIVAGGRMVRDGPGAILGSRPMNWIIRNG